LHKRDVSDHHHNIDRVEIFFTNKASGQIRSWVYRRIEFTTLRTLKAKSALADFRSYPQNIHDHGFNGNVISDSE
jgi:hypothetical protein